MASCQRSPFAYAPNFLVKAWSRIRPLPGRAAAISRPMTRPSAATCATRLLVSRRHHGVTRPRGSDDTSPCIWILLLPSDEASTGNSYQNSRLAGWNPTFANIDWRLRSQASHSMESSGAQHGWSGLGPVEKGRTTIG
jgi:hypothetical protein